jgi:crotonobetainyl-CoA:carnitine CoA-transferase CaiB-like acyl-CoA transferase
MAGFGKSGPESLLPGYGPMIESLSGIASLTGYGDGQPRMASGYAYGDPVAAVAASAAALAARLVRARTGRGQHVDISMLESMLASDDYAHLALDAARTENGVVVNEVWDIPGGPIVIAGDFRWIWQRLHATFDLVDTSPPGATIAQKSEHRHAAVAKFFAGFSERAPLLAALAQADLAFGEIKDSAAALQSPALHARGAVASVDNRAGGARKVINSPYRYSDAHSGAHGVAPYRGEHNRAVLREWLALSDADVDALVARGVLLDEPRPA